MNVLVINAGSSSLKYQLINMVDQQVLCKGQVERIGIEGSFLKQKGGAEEADIHAEIKWRGSIVGGDRCSGPSRAAWRRKVCRSRFGG